MTTAAATSPTEPQPASKGRPRRRWHRWLVLGGLLVATVAVALTHSPLTGWIVGGQVAAALGCDASVGSASVHTDGRVIIHDLVLRVPGLDGPAGEFLRAPRVEVDVDWTPLVSFSPPRVSGVRLHEPLARIGVLRDGSGVSLSGLRAAPGGGGTRPPRVDAFGAVLEFGEYDHGGDNYHELRELSVTGSLSPLSTTDPKFSVKLQEQQAMSGERGILLEGELDLPAAGSAGPVLELHLHNVDLARWSTKTVPAVMREVWATLGMRGKVTLATLRFDGSRGSGNGPNGDFRVTMDLADVSMNALIPSDVPSRPGAADKPLALTEVNGTIAFESKGLTARLKGKVEDMPAQVVLTTDGVGLDAPVRCELIIEKFEVSKDPDLMPFAPPVVRENFARFSGPTAVVNARVVVTRGAGSNGKPGEVSTEGTIEFENGAAAFEKFPYPVEQMRGMVKFDDKAVELRNIRGRGPSGAIVSADGRVYPPRKGAEMLINVLVLDAPIDEYLLGAMTPDKRAVLEKLFNRTAADELERCGLTSTPEAHARAALELERVRGERAAAERLAGEGVPPEAIAALAARETELTAAAARPVFELGGKVGIDVRVFSPLDENTWDWSVNVSFPRAGVLPSVFPLPMVLTGGELALDAREAKLVKGTFTGLSGGTAAIEADVKFDGPDAEPNVRIHADVVPVDALLLHAVAYDQDLGRAPEAPRGDSGAALLSRLALEGTVGCTAVVLPGDKPGGEPVYDVTVDVDGLRARPADAAADGVRLEDVRGRIRVEPGHFEVPGLSGTMVSGSSGPEGAGTPIGRLSIMVDQTRARAGSAGEGAGGLIDAEVTVQDLDISAPFESLVGVVAAKAADRLRGLRAEHEPRGVLDASVRYAERSGQEPRMALRIDNPRGLEVDALGGRVGLSKVEGSVEAVIEGSTSVAFDGVGAEVSFDGEPGGKMVVTGEADVGEPRRDGPERALNLNLDDARLESALTRALVRQFAGESAADAFGEARPAGEFGAGARITSSPRGRGVWARIEPRGVKGLVAERNIEFAATGGAVTVEHEPESAPGAAHGRIDGIAGRLGTADVLANGDWGVEPEGGAEVRLTFDASASSLDETVVALLPERLRSGIEERKLRVRGPVAARDARLSWRRERTGAEPAVEFAGDLAFENASLDAGIDVANAGGTARVDFSGAPAPGGERWTLDLDVPSLTAEGVALENLDGSLDGGGGRGVRLRSLAADCHGGRLVAQAVTRPETGSGEPARYEATMTLSGARFASVLTDLRKPESAGGPEAVGEAGVESGSASGSASGSGSGQGHADDESRGWIDASLSLSGEPGKPRTRLGGGSVRVSGGDVVRLSLVLPLLEMSNLALPAQSSLDYADATFRVAGERVELAHAAILSDSIGLVGYGTVELPDRALDLKFNTLAATRIPLWSDMWEMVRNEIVGTAVRGTIDDPTFEPESLGGTRRLLGNIFGPRGTEVEFDPVKVDAASRAERARLKRASVPPVRPAGSPLP
jgi:hypothetical protein